jgi:hypothetical protein
MSDISSRAAGRHGLGFLFFFRFVASFFLSGSSFSLLRWSVGQHRGGNKRELGGGALRTIHNKTVVVVVVLFFSCFCGVWSYTRSCKTRWSHTLGTIRMLVHLSCQKAIWLCQPGTFAGI